MKKIKSFLAVVMLSLFSCFCFSACMNKDDDKNSNNSTGGNGGTTVSVTDVVNGVKNNLTGSELVNHKAIIGVETVSDYDVETDELILQYSADAGTETFSITGDKTEIFEYKKSGETYLKYVYNTADKTFVENVSTQKDYADAKKYCVDSISNYVESLIDTENTSYENLTTSAVLNNETYVVTIGCDVVYGASDTTPYSGRIDNIAVTYKVKNNLPSSISITNNMLSGAVKKEVVSYVYQTEDVALNRAEYAQLVDFDDVWNAYIENIEQNGFGNYVIDSRRITIQNNEIAETLTTKQQYSVVGDVEKFYNTHNDSVKFVKYDKMSGVVNKSTLIENVYSSSQLSYDDYDNDIKVQSLMLWGINVVQEFVDGEYLAENVEVDFKAELKSGVYTLTINLANTENAEQTAVIVVKIQDGKMISFESTTNNSATDKVVITLRHEYNTDAIVFDYITSDEVMQVVQGLTESIKANGYKNHTLKLENIGGQSTTVQYYIDGSVERILCTNIDEDGTDYYFTQFTKNGENIIYRYYDGIDYLSGEETITDEERKTILYEELPSVVSLLQMFNELDSGANYNIYGYINNDGTYTLTITVDEENNYGKYSLTIDDGNVVSGEYIIETQLIGSMDVEITVDYTTGDFEFETLTQAECEDLIEGIISNYEQNGIPNSKIIGEIIDENGEIEEIQEMYYSFKDGTAKMYTTTSQSGEVQFVIVEAVDGSYIEKVYIYDNGVKLEEHAYELTEEQYLEQIKMGSVLFMTESLLELFDRIEENTNVCATKNSNGDWVIELKHSYTYEDSSTTYYEVEITVSDRKVLSVNSDLYEYVSGKYTYIGSENVSFVYNTPDVSFGATNGDDSLEEVKDIVNSILSSDIENHKVTKDITITENDLSSNEVYTVYYSCDDGLEKVLRYRAGTTSENYKEYQVIDEKHVSKSYVKSIMKYIELTLTDSRYIDELVDAGLLHGMMYQLNDILSLGDTVAEIEGLTISMQTAIAETVIDVAYTTGTTSYTYGIVMTDGKINSIDLIYTDGEYSEDIKITYEYGTADVDFDTSNYSAL